MTASMKITWDVYNQEYLESLLARIEMLIANDDAINDFIDPKINQDQQIPAIELLCEKFSLSRFEKDLLLLVSAPELNSDIKLLLGEVNGDVKKNYNTLGFAISILPGAHWDALTPIATLRHWHLIEVMSGPDLMDSRLRIDEKILHYIVGVNYIDDRLTGYISQNKKLLVTVPSHEDLASKIVEQWFNVSEREFLVQLTGKAGNGVKSVCQTISNQTGYDFYILNAKDIPQAFVERQLFIRLYQRESILNNILLLVDLRDDNDTRVIEITKEFIANIQSPCIVSTTDEINLSAFGCAYYEVDKPTPEEQKSLWNHVFKKDGENLSDDIEQLVAQFNMGPDDIVSASHTVKEKDPGDVSLKALWSVCQQFTRGNIAGLAQRVLPKSKWQDLILPEQQMNTLLEIAAHMRQRKKVYDSWGFSEKTSQGLGISALFSGESGTGKTMSAETLANELNLDLYRIDLSSVVSKYIGETEKNLRRIFDAAEISGAILLFDEADALFGKRSEVKDSHDRYANIEVSYLLQRMEAYRGLAILTTNLRRALDTAFIRRIRFIVHYPYPDPIQREEIWRGIFPEQTPVRNLDVKKLSQLNVAGGNIKNIAMSAAFLAADESEPVCMCHLLHAARTECSKLERPLTDSEIKGWL